MKITCLISLIFFSLLLCFCSDSSVSETNLKDGFNIYLLKESSLTIKDIKDKSLSDLKLTDEPLISISDIEYYNWDDHSFSLSHEKIQEIKKICDTHRSVFGQPFVVTVNQERIYLGAFWTAISSVAPEVPFILDEWIFDDNLNVLTIAKSWTAQNQDVRNDQRVYKVFKENDLLVE